jgi:hypothetical protein
MRRPLPLLSNVYGNGHATVRRLTNKRIQDKHLLATVPSLPIQRLFRRTLQTSLFADTVMCAFSTRTNCNAAAQLPEVGSEMATRALLPKPPVMHVVAVVAVNATPTCGVYGLAGPCMAGNACELSVRPIDNKSGFFMMVKVPDAPIACVVTNITC